MESPQHFVESYIDAWNSHDAPAVAGHLGAHGRYIDVPSQQQLAGETLIEHLVDYFSSDNYRYDIVGDVLFNGNTIAFQYRVVPEHPAAGDPGLGRRRVHRTRGRCRPADKRLLQAAGRGLPALGTGY